MPSGEDTTAVYWDACCFIGVISREHDKIAELEPMVDRAVAGKLKRLM